MHLGDSGYALYHVIPMGKSFAIQQYFKSEPMNVSFDTSKRFGPDGNTTVGRLKEINHTEALDGDIIMLYTDGFSDNVFEEDWDSCIADGINQFTGKPISLSEIADCQARKAYINMEKPMSTPFSKESIAAKKPKQFGNIDDISVTIALFQMDSKEVKYDRMGVWNEDAELFDGPVFTYNLEKKNLIKEHKWDSEKRA